MYRTSSWNRFGDELYTSSTASSVMRSYNPAAMEGIKELSSEAEPISESETDDNKQRDRRNKFAQNAVHVIPLVLLLSAFLLWFFSNPESAVVKLREDSIPARIEGSTIGGDNDTESDGTQISTLPVDSVLENDVAMKHAILEEDTNIKGHSHLQYRLLNLENSTSTF